MTKQLRVIVTGALAVVGLVAAEPAWGQVQQLIATTQPIRTISVTGEATIYATPDEVHVTFGVEHVSAKLADAKANNDEAAAKLVQALKSLGIAEKDITSGMSISLEQKPRPRPRINDSTEGSEGDTVARYWVKRQYQVTLKDISKLPALIDTALGNGANRMYGFYFASSKKEQLQTEARVKAVGQAKARAKALADELGVSVGMPNAVTEGYSPIEPMMARNVMMAADMAGGGGSEGTMPLGQIAVRGNVNVVFEIK